MDGQVWIKDGQIQTKMFKCFPSVLSLLQKFILYVVTKVIFIRQVDIYPIIVWGALTTRLSLFGFYLCILLKFCHKVIIVEAWGNVLMP